MSNFKVDIEFILPVVNVFPTQTFPTEETLKTFLEKALKDSFVPSVIVSVVENPRVQPVEK
jgi:hypothetical protein